MTLTARRPLRRLAVLAMLAVLTTLAAADAAHAGQYPMYAGNVPGITLPAPSQGAWTRFDTSGKVQSFDELTTKTTGASAWWQINYPSGVLGGTEKVGLELVLPPTSNVSIGRVFDWSATALTAQNMHGTPEAGAQGINLAASIATAPGGDASGWNGTTTTGAGHDSGALGANTKSRQLGVICPYLGAGYLACTLPSPFLRIRGIKTLLSESVAPAGAITGGTATSTAPLKGTKVLDYTATDGDSGVEKVEALIDDTVVGTDSFARDLTQPVAQQSGDCTYTAINACPTTQTDELPIDTTKVPDGVHTLALRVKDAAGNTKNVAWPTPIRVDNIKPPGAPINLKVLGGEDWRSTDGFTVTWANPANDLPIVKANMRLCPGMNPYSPLCADSSQSGVDIHSLAGIGVGTPGAYTLWVTIEDESGPTTIDSTGEPVFLRFDDGAPGRPFATRSDGWLNAQQAKQVSLTVSAPTDVPISGVAGYSYSTDGSDPDASVDVDATASTIVLSHLPEGDSTVKVRAVSNAGVPSAQVDTTTLHVDRSAPVAAVQSEPPAGWQPGAVTVTMLAVDPGRLSGMDAAPADRPVADGAYVEYRIDGGDWTRARGDHAAITVDPARLGDGEHTVHMRGVDVAGNVGDEITRVIRVDAADPGRTDLTGPAGWLNAAAATDHGVSVGLADAAPASGLAGFSVTTDGSDPDARVDVTGATWALPVLGEGEHTLKARAVSGAGRVGPVSALTVRIDRTGPSVAPAHEPPSDWQPGPVTFAVDAVDPGPLSGMAAAADGDPVTAGAYAEYRVDEGDWHRERGAHATVTVDPADVGDGAHSVHLRAADAAGNLGAEITRTVRVDGSAPPAATLDVTPAWLGPKAAAALAVTPALAGAAPASGLAGYAVAVDDAPGSAVNFAPGAGWKPAADLPEGVHTLRARAVNAVGRAGATATATVRIDRGGPTVGVVAEPTSAWSADPVSFEIRATDPGSLSGMTAAADEQPIAHGAFTEYRIDSGVWRQVRGDHATVTVDPADVGDGPHTVHFRATDVAGNVGDQAARTVRLDAGDPGDPVLEVSQTWLNAAHAVSLRTVGGVSALAGHSVGIDDETPDETVDVAPDDAWRPLGALADGIHTLHARAVSGAGRPGRIASATVKIDRGAPTVALEGVPAGDGWSRDAVHVTATGLDGDGLSGMGAAPDGAPVESGAYVQLRVDGGDWQRSAGAGGARRLDADGAHKVEAQAVDAAGNASSIASANVRIDRTPPASGTFVVSRDGSRIVAPVSDSASGIADVVLQVRARRATASVPVAAVRAGAAAGAGWIDLPTEVRDGVAASDLTAAGLPDGDYEIRALITDAAGNTATWGGSDAALATPLRLQTPKPSPARPAPPQIIVVREVVPVVVAAPGAAPAGAGAVRPDACRLVRAGRSSARLRLGSRTAQVHITVPSSRRPAGPLVATVSAARGTIRRVGYRLDGRPLPARGGRAEVRPGRLGAASAKLTVTVTPRTGRARSTTITLKAAPCDGRGE